MILYNMRVAICYFGLLRSLKMVYHSHIDKIFNELITNNIEYDIFLHSWKTADNKQHVWENIINVKQDYEIPHKIQEKILVKKFDYQQDFLNSIDFNEYFYKEEYKKYGERKEWRPQLIRNHLCALESMKRVKNLVNTVEIEYDYIMILRPDSKINNLFPVKEVIDFLNTNKKGICVPDFGSYEGYNDRFAIMNNNYCKEFCERINEISQFRKTNGRIVSEKFTKYIIDKYYKLKQINFHFDLIRPK